MSIFVVPEIHCEGCVLALTGAVKGLDTQAVVQADLQTKRVHVQTAASDAEVVEAFEDAGFSVETA